MDKRTILFVLSLTLTLFFVNIYFQTQNEDTLRQWNEQQKAKKIQKEKQLESEISQNLVKVEALPLVKVYADREDSQLLALGVSSDGTLLVEAWNNQLPSKIFAKQLKNPETIDEFSLLYSPQAKGQLALYGNKEKAFLPIGTLPEFGKYYLQLLPSEKTEKIKTSLGEYIDGHFSFVDEKIAQLKNETREEQLPIPKLGNAIALVKTAQGFLPVAFYNSSLQELTLLDEIPDLHSFVKKSETKQISSSSKSEEKFYVIENSFQQLVFSNYGGAIVEINLPFKSKENQESVVKEIEFDRQMVEYHPYNAHFPAHAYYTPGKTPDASYQEHSQGKLGGYYPLIRRDLFHAKNKISRIPPHYYAFNLVSEYPELAELVYQVKHFDKTSIVFEAQQMHRRITKTYSVRDELEGAPYCLELTIAIEGDSRGLWLTSGVPEVEWISGGMTPSLKYRITRNQKAVVETIDPPKDSLTVSSVYPDWLCNSNGFLGIILDPLTEIDSGYRVQHVPGNVVPSRLSEIDPEKFKVQSMPGYMTLLPLKSSGGSMQFRIFAGPFSDGILKTVDKVYTDAATGYNPDYIACQSFHGWFAFISEPFARFLFILMKFFHQITGSWAFSIILLTVALRIMMYPLNSWSNRSMLRMQQIAPEVTAIQEKYKKDPKKAQLEIMNLYRERGVNPLSGCFPLLIQMPFLIGMFDLLKSTFELRGASFIPGWIDNLAAPDVLFSWSTPLFFIGNEFHLLPLLLGGVMFLQQRLMSSLPKDQKLWTDQQRQQRAMGNVMAVIFTIMFYNFPSGLNLYWLSSMILGIIQQWWNGQQIRKHTQTIVVENEKSKSKVRKAKS